MRLIDADRLLFHSCNDMKDVCRYWGSGNCYTCQKALITRADIDNAPTVVNEYTKGFADGERSGRHLPLTDEEKAMLVRQWRPRGEWIFDGVYRDENNPIDSDVYHCSICKRSITTTLTRPTDLFPFCHCGAEMRVKDELGCVKK